MITKTAETDSQARVSARILLVDDCEVNRVAAQQSLEHAGYEVDTAECGQQAVDAHRRRSYDLILMDIMMPDMDGYEASRRIRLSACDAPSGSGGDCRSSYPDADRCPESGIAGIPIIAMSGSITDEVLDDCNAAGMDDCIGKPLRPELLLPIVQKWTGRQAQPENLKKPPIPGCRPVLTSTDDQAPIEIDKTIEEFLGRTDVLLDVIRDFVDKVRNHIAAMGQHISAGDFRQIRSTAHLIKGGAANLRAFRLSNTAAELERAAIDEEPGEAIVRVDRLKEEFGILSQYLEQTGLPRMVQMTQMGSQLFQASDEDSDCG